MKSDSTEITRLSFLKILSREINPLEYALNEYGYFHGSKLIRQLESISSNYVVLIVDPGVIIRFKDFISYLKSLEELPADPWAARQKYSEELGVKTVYRSITLYQTKDLDQILANGLTSNYLYRTLSESIEDQSKVLFEELGNGLLSNMHKKFGKVLDGRAKYNLFQSVSYFPDVSLSIATSKYGDREKKIVLLFELNIPRLDLIQLSKNSSIKYPFYLNYGRKIFKLRGETYFLNHFRNIYYFDYKIESLVFYQIEPIEIRKVFLFNQEDRMLPKWNAKLLGNLPGIQYSKDLFLNSIKHKQIYPKGGQ